ncbi:MAG: trimethylamine methyltransferase family protein, partial [Dethiobacteria bacterium]|nr:trimethylamine methyltransferase family protein [Dethiobacteria bacterium]
SRGINLDSESMALDLIDEIGPGGAFLTTDHTFHHFRDFWQPKYFNRRRRDDWVAGGSKSMGEKLREKVVEIMDNHRPVESPAGLSKEINYILANSK